ncbi:hypothetical protein QOZ80_1BG0075530 [Eleusine coracana subsp. coracana]|nr:hypothetical protein QOZ80_1BG0075530 [Eleusine coracana subsp. coracana]
MFAANPPHVVLLACPAGGGHILPMVELGRRLAEHHSFTATIITYSNMSVPALPDLPASVTTAALPAVPLDDLPADARIETCMLTVVRRAMPHLRALLASIIREHGSHNVVAFLADMFCAEALLVASELGVPGSYIVFLTNLMFLGLLVRLPELDKITTCEYRDLPEPVRLPGCVPLRGADLLDTIQDGSNPAYSLMVEMARNQFLADGILVNTSTGWSTRPSARSKSCRTKASSVPRFTRGGTLSTEQTTELAAGLEACGHRFLWVVHFPSDKDSSATYFGTGGHGDDPLGFLPQGFIQRTKDVGLCVPHWAPQVEILQHRAVGGFLSHCGWNSTLEAVDASVPMLAWPLFAEQRMNAVMLEEKVGMELRLAGLRQKGNEITREEVAAVVTELMAGETGKAVRKRAKTVKKAAAQALEPLGAVEQGGRGNREQVERHSLQGGK